MKDVLHYIITPASQQPASGQPAAGAGAGAAGGCYTAATAAAAVNRPYHMWWERAREPTRPYRLGLVGGAGNQRPLPMYIHMYCTMCLYAHVCVGRFRSFGRLEGSKSGPFQCAIAFSLRFGDGREVGVGRWRMGGWWWGGGGSVGLMSLYSDRHWRVYSYIIYSSPLL